MVRDLNKGIGDATTDGISYNHLNLPTEVIINDGGTNNGTISYIYDATGVKLQKNVLENGVNSPTDYAGNYVYENGNLKQFYTAEGYAEPKDANDYSAGFQYVYRYTDIWGNTRITYADDNGNGTIETGGSYSEIRREQNYYPFGLEHKGYNTVMNGAKNNLKTYQGQEFTEDLGLNTHEWRYRMSDPAIGRFWQIDPLAEDFMYNSTYAFQENKLGMGIELEGAEVLGWDLAQDLVMRAVNFFDGADKMVTGGSNMLNESVNGKMAERKMAESNQTTDTQGPQMDPNFQMVLEGSGQVAKALPNKQDVRNVANGTELAGDVIKVGGITATAVSGGTASPVSLPAIAVGEVTSNIGLGLNLAVDLAEGDLDQAAQRVGVEVISFGFGSFVRQSGAGDAVVEEATSIIAGKGSEKIIESVPKKQ